MRDFFKFIWERLTLQDIPRGSGRSNKVPLGEQAANQTVLGLSDTRDTI